MILAPEEAKNFHPPLERIMATTPPDVGRPVALERAPFISDEGSQLNAEDLQLFVSITELEGYLLRVSLLGRADQRTFGNSWAQQFAAAAFAV